MRRWRCRCRCGGRTANNDDDNESEATTCVNMCSARVVLHSTFSFRRLMSLFRLEFYGRPSHLYRSTHGTHILILSPPPPPIPLSRFCSRKHIPLEPTICINVYALCSRSPFRQRKSNIETSGTVVSLHIHPIFTCVCVFNASRHSQTRHYEKQYGIRK